MKTTALILSLLLGSSYSSTHAGSIKEQALLKLVSIPSTLSVQSDPVLATSLNSPTFTDSLAIIDAAIGSTTADPLTNLTQGEVREL